MLVDLENQLCTESRGLREELSQLYIQRDLLAAHVDPGTAARILGPHYEGFVGRFQSRSHEVASGNGTYRHRGHSE